MPDPALLACYAHADQALAGVVDLAQAEVDEREEMACFDQLPAALKDALTDHPLKITAQSVLGRFHMFARRLGDDGAKERVKRELAELAA